jgi:hypothetical protein
MQQGILVLLLLVCLIQLQLLIHLSLAMFLAMDFVMVLFAQADLVEDQRHTHTFGTVRLRRRHHVSQEHVRGIMQFALLMQAAV